MDNPKKLILDYSKWRCGEDGPNKVGEGPVRLLNPEGFSCCLGQWCHQLGATKEETINKWEPDEIMTLVPLFAHYEDDVKRSNRLSDECIHVNDDPDTTPEEKIEKLKKRLAKEGIELEVINKP